MLIDRKPDVVRRLLNEARQEAAAQPAECDEPLQLKSM